MLTKGSDAARPALLLGRMITVSTVLLVAAVAALAAPAPAAPSNGLALGIFDDATTFDPEQRDFPALQQIHAQVLRMTLAWGGPGGVANTRPAKPADPTDAAYEWSRYDQAIESASGEGMQVLLTIIGTPPWANGGKTPQHPPESAITLRRFAYAAARRYSGTFLNTATGRVLPRVSLWLAWNEPNNSVFLQPQFTRANGTWRMASAAAYVRICGAVYAGVHAAGGPEQVACGATAPRGYNDPASSRPSISPVAFLRAVKRLGLRKFDAWAHHPYYGSPSQTPTTRKVGSHTIGLGNIDVLITELTHLYGRKPLWITEYGYQTNPPDTLFGVSWQRQADYLRQAVEIARANPRIELLIWFLLRDSPSRDSWQSGLITADGRRKPAFAEFARLLRGSV
jgi:hypothetical protein